MTNKKAKIKYVECKTCTAKGKIMLPEDIEFDWKVIPCPLCMSEDLQEITKELTEKEIDFTFNPKGIQEETTE